MTHLLDTSAFLTLFLDQPGGERVAGLLQEDAVGMACSTITVFEFWARLKALGEDQAFESEWSMHEPLFEAVLAVDARVTERAIALRRATPERLPAIDALIAATASVFDLVLVHCDAHFRSIPPSLVRQLDVSEPPAVCQ